MNTRKTVKYSFLLIITLLFFIFLANSISSTITEENLKLKQKVSKLVIISNQMNQVLEDIIFVKSKQELNNKKEEFDKIEHSFEEQFDSIRTASFAFLSDEELSFIDFKLKAIEKNEKEIESFFDKLFTLKINEIDLTNTFNLQYDNEKRDRIIIENYVYKYENFDNFKILSDVKYFSKEFLFQKKDTKHLNMWIDAIRKLTIQKDLRNNYIQSVTEISNTVLSNNTNENNIKLLLEDIKEHLKENKVLNNNILDKLDLISFNFVSKMQNISVGLIIFLILVTLFSSVRVIKIVNRNQSEIEAEVSKGLKEINNLNHEIEDTQKEVVFTMGAIAESRSKETGNHVKRVAEYSKLLAELSGLSREESELLKQASPMHDIGKIAIPDAVLNKPGRFNDEEREIMNNHSQYGYDMLKHSNRPILKAASIVSYEHHERWDGKGYPRGLKGEEIHIFARITSIADVFDALGSDRCYKKAWEDEKIFNLFKDERGKQFDPKLIDLFFENLNKFIEIRDSLKDKFEDE